ncbi:MAG: flagellar basal body-associated FliL family protein [Spongiibacteraceae bacterium]
MAEDNETQDTDSPATGKSIGGKTKLILWILLGLLVVAGSVGVTLYLLGFFDKSAAENLSLEDAALAQEELNKPAPAMYFPIKPAFVINFSSRGKQRYLQTDITILTRDIEVFSAIQAHSPLIKNHLIMLLSGEIYEELQTDEGKELLRQKLLVALNGIMQQEIGKDGIEEVLFTSFVMQ